MSFARGSAERGRPGPLTDLRPLSLAALAGTSMLHLLPALPPSWAYVACALLAVLPWRGRWLCMAVLLAAGWSHWHAASYLESRWPESRHGEDLVVTGWVASLPDRDRHSLRIRFRFHPLDGAEGSINVKVYRPRDDIHAGECLRLRLKLRPPRGLSNPGGFDVEGWAYREGITAQAYVRDLARCTDAERARIPILPASLLRIRSGFADWIGTHLQGHPQRGVVAGLTVGDDHAIEDAQWDALRRTGTIHLISISGLHIALIAGVIFALVRRIWPLWPALALRCPAQRAAAFAGIIAALAYAALAGFSIPTQRSFIMSAVVLGAVALGRATDAARVLALALIAVLAVEPAAVMHPGFWLSFLAVAWLGFLLSARLRPHGKLMLWFGLQLALAAALAPAVLYLFGETSISSPLANLIMIPAYTVLLPLLLLVVIGGAAGMPAAGALLAVLAETLEWLWQVIEWMSASPISTWAAAQVSLLWTAAASIGLFLLLAPRAWPLRLAGAGLCVPLLWPVSQPPPRAAFDLTLLDVGQGLSAVVRTNRHALLFDAGPAGPGYDAGKSVVLPYLRSSGITRLDSVVISHGDMDHRGGLPAILATLPVSRRWGAAGGTPCQSGTGWAWDGVEFLFLHPDHGEWQGNDRSCVLRVSAGQETLLLTGDISAAVERSLIVRRGERLPADVLVLAHHGSATSSSLEFLRAVSPSLALIPAGWKNRYRHPSLQVLRRLNGGGIRWLNTAGEGAIQLRIGAGIATPKSWRQARHRFWNRASADTTPLAAVP